MTGKKALISNFKEKDGPAVIFGDNNSRKTRGYDTIGNDVVSISKVAFVKGLKYNLLSIRHLCDKWHQVIFLNNQC